DRDYRIGLVDAIDDGRVADVVVIGAAGEEPVVAGIRPGVDVGRVAHVHSANSGPGLAIHTSDRRDRRRVRMAVVGGGETGVRRDRERRIGLADHVVDGRVADDGVVVGGGDGQVVPGLRTGVGGAR